MPGPPDILIDLVGQLDLASRIELAVGLLEEAIDGVVADPTEVLLDIAPGAVDLAGDSDR